jgi:hypothetical protein
VDIDASDFIKNSSFTKRTDSHLESGATEGSTKMNLMRTRPWKKEVLRVELSERSYPTMA